MTYHQLKYLLWSVVVGVTLSLTSCMKWDYGDAVEDFNATGAGLFITNEGNKGAIDRLGNYHPQEFYYPLWIEEDSYTLYGTCLKARTEQSPSTGMWSNNPFGWGYADNIGDDMPNKDNPNAGALGNYFKISDALNIDGTSANLSHIDFIKVQTGVNVKAGWLGENSTEVFKFCDENNNNDK
jgi:hypothetical protein